MEISSSTQLIERLQRELHEQDEEIRELKQSLASAKIVMKYYDKNKGIHPMLKDFATEWLEINEL